MREVGQALITRGYEVELAVGVDGDAAVIIRAIETMSGHGLYVLCRSPALDRSAVDKLREVLRTHDVPFGRTLTLAVETQTPRDVEERIVSVLRRMVTGRADGRPKAWGSSVPHGEDDPDTTVNKAAASTEPEDPAAVLLGLGTEPEHADPHASTSQIEVFAQSQPEIVSAIYTGADHTAVGPAPRAPIETATDPVLPQVPAAAQPGVPVAASSSMGSQPIAPSAAVAGFPSQALAPGASAPSAPVAPSPDSMSSEGSSAPVVAPGMPDMPGAPGQLPAGISAAVDTDDDWEPPLTFGGRMGRVLGSPAGLAAVLGGLALVVLVWVITAALRDDEDEAQAKADQDPAADAQEAPTEDEAEPADEDAAAKADEGERDPAADGDPTQVVAERSEGDGESASDEAKPADEAPADSPTPGSAEEPEPAPEVVEPEPAPEVAEPEPAPEVVEPTPEPAAAADPGPSERPVSADEDPPDVIAALRSREVRAIDVFVVAPERRGTLSYERAVDYCNELEVAGLEGWRVPAIGELNAVATARMLGRAVYWSSTPGDTFGDLMLVLNTKKNRISVVTKGWDGAKIVCIRPRQP